MDLSEFIRVAEVTPQELDRRIEASGIDADCAFSATGVLEIGFGDGARWVDTRDEAEPFAALSACVSPQAGDAVNLRTPEAKTTGS